MRAIWLGAIVLLLAAQRAQAEGCDAIVAAQDKDPGVPVRSSMTLAMNGMTFAIVTVSANGKVYNQRKDGTWKTEDHAKPRDERERREYWQKEVCAPAGSDVLDGQPTDIVSDHNSDIPTDTRFWISKPSGLILKSEITYKNGSTMTMVYDYKNVQAPDTSTAAPSRP